MVIQLQPKSGAIILLVCVLSAVTLVQTVAGAGPVHVSVVCGGCPPGGPVPAGGTFHITFYTDVGHNGHINIYDRPSGSATHIWDSGSIAISGGLAYDVVPPPINTPGTYVAGGLFFPSGGGVDLDEKTFQVVGPASVSTDWAVLSVSLTPSSPHPGDPVTFGMIASALSSTGAFPQSLTAQCTIDGASCGTGSLSYPGPSGTPETVTAGTLWMATPGTHTLTWSISMAGDPNPSNNVMSTSFTVAPQAQFDFSISVSPQQQTVAPGGGTSYGVTVNLVSGTPQSVGLSLSGAPAGVSGAFSPTSGTPSFSSTLSITTTSSVSPGTFTLTATGSGGGVTHAATFNLVVSQTPDFRIDVGSPSQSVLQGQTASYSLSIVGLNGFNSQVSLTVSGLPSGANGVFSTPSASPNFQSTLTVTLPSNTPTGSYTLTVTGTGGGLTRVANLVLTVTQAAVTSSSTQTTSLPIPGLPSDLMGMLQQNSLLVIGAILALIALLAAVALRRRKPSGPGTGTQGSKAGTVFCGKCGTQNPAGNEFCRKCGAKL